MTLDLVLAFGGLAIVGVIVWSIVGARQSHQAELKAENDLKQTETRGALPPSLHPRVDLDVCIGSGTCIEACPENGVLGLVKNKARLTNPTSCIGHGECLRACPVDAITLVLGTAKRGVEIPMLETDFSTNVEGLYIVGELGGMGLIYNAVTQGLQCMRGVVSRVPARVDGVHQLVVVGAGPAGLAASLAALEAKLDFVTLDQESIGGTVLHYPRQKIVMTRPVKLPLYGDVKVDTVRKEALLEVWEDVINKTGLEVRTRTKVDGVNKGDDGIFTIATSGGELRAQTVVLAMGRRGSPRKLNIPGEDLSKVTYRLLEPEHYAGAEVMVVGGGDSAVEAACALGENGAKVKLCYRRKVFDRIKPKNQERLDGAVKGGNVELLVESNPRSIHENSVVVDVAGEEREIDNQFIIILAGGVLPTKFLEAAGVEVRTFKGEAFAPANV